jgi:quinol monooxygenase YgiN
MYGTVARMKAKPGMIDQLSALANREQGSPPPGSVALLVFQMDADPNEFILVAVAENEETYRANAESPEQHEVFLEMMQYLEAEPEWNDGQVVTYLTT